MSVLYFLVLTTLCLGFHNTEAAIPSANTTAFRSYGVVFPPLDPRFVPPVDPNTATVLTLCEIWENDSIPVTPGIEWALKRISPHFALKNITFRLLRRSIPSGCGDSTLLAVSPTLVEMHLSQSHGGCHLVIGPSCSEPMENIRGLVEYWNIPVVTSGASGIKFSDKKRTDVLTRFGYTQEDVSFFLIRVLDHFNWTNVVFLYDVDSSISNDFQASFQQVIQSQRVDLYRTIEFSKVMLEKNADVQWMKDTLAKSMERSRIFVLAAAPPFVYEIMLAASELGMLTSEYVYITTNLIETRAHGFSDLSFLDRKAKNDTKAGNILDSLLLIRMKLPADDPLNKEEYDQFADSIKAISTLSYNYTYSPGEQVTHLVLGIWDAVMFYALALNATLSSNGDIRDGRTITSKIWGHSFMGVVIECTISPYGDRNFPYFLEDYNAERGTFQPVLWLDNERLQLARVDNNSIHWPGNLRDPPRNEPVCGYSGKTGACAVNALPPYAVILIALACLSVVGSAIIFYLYRWKLKITNDDSWRIKITEIVPKERRSANGGSSLKSLGKGAEDGRTLATRDSRASSVSYVATAYFKELVVAVKMIQCNVTHISAQHLFELRVLRQMIHEHVARFHGLCQDPTTPCIVMEHCAKGSLTNLLDNDAVNLDWIFKFSLANDVVDGILYVHNSPFKSHGRLTSNNCLIDGRFIVKIGDLGLSTLRPSTTSLQHSSLQDHTLDSYNAFRALLWRAPELLRAPMPANGTPKGDIYSFAIILQQIIQRTGPFERIDQDMDPLDVADLIARVRDSLIPPYRPRVPFDLCPPELYTIMLRCWSEEPNDRYDGERLRNLLRSVPGNKSRNLMDDLISYFYLLIARQMRRMEKYANDLEDKVNERTAEFMDEKKRSEDLLYQMLPRPVANKLKQGHFVGPEAFDMVTIYFSDIVGFTSLCMDSTPMQVVDLLNDLYTLFDGVIENYDVYKVETIGDAYVVVSGLPARNETRHALEISRMSLQVITALKAFRMRHKPNEQILIRIGVHSGPVAAGVVGLKMPRFCIFGDSVNIASRLESTSEPMRVQISIFTKRLLDGNKDFQPEFRGEIELKGRGNMVTYWLHSANATLLLM